MINSMAKEYALHMLFIGRTNRHRGIRNDIITKYLYVVVQVYINL